MGPDVVVPVALAHLLAQIGPGELAPDVTKALSPEGLLAFMVVSAVLSTVATAVNGFFTYLSRRASATSSGGGSEVLLAIQQLAGAVTRLSEVVAGLADSTEDVERELEEHRRGLEEVRRTLATLTAWFQAIAGGRSLPPPGGTS